MPRITDGIKNCSKLTDGLAEKAVYSIGGLHPHQSAGKTITIVPSQKVGTAMQKIAKLRAI
jgi:hypothetical protein